MSSFADEERAIHSQLANNFTALPIKYENHPFNQPNNSAYVAVTILRGAGAQISTNGVDGGGPLNRWAGVIQLDVYVPEDSGSRVALGHADTLEAIFRHKQFSAGSSGRIITRVPAASSGFIEGGFYRIPISVPYQRDSVN